MVYKKLAKTLDKMYIDYKLIHHYEANEIKLKDIDLSFIWWGDDTFTIKGINWEDITEHSLEECIYIAVGEWLTWKYADSVPPVIGTT